MVEWVYNENDSGHRGVWHVAARPIEYQQYPESSKTYEQNVYVYHTRKCSRYLYGDEPNTRYNPERGWNVEPYPAPPCTCKAGTNHIAGTFTVVHVSPAYTTRSAVNALCGQVKIYGRGWVDFPYSTKGKVGSTVTVVGKPPRLNVWGGDGIPPGPTCSRCIRKAENISKN